MDFEKMFGESSDSDRKLFLDLIQKQWECWPDQVALYSNMVQNLIDDGWTEMAARTIVLSNVTITNLAMLANMKEPPDDNGT